jgi:hypothetical protein
VVSKAIAATDTASCFITAPKEEAALK